MKSVESTPEPAVAVGRNSVVIGGLRIGTLSRASWADLIAAECQERRSVVERRAPAFFTSANANVLSQSANSNTLRSILENADGIDADGMPIVVASRLITRNAIPERCCTTDFIHDMAQAAVRRDLSFFLLGATEEANKRAEDELTSRYPGLRIVGRRHGYFSAEDEGEVVDEINRTAPDLLWVGLGVPKEQEFVERNRQRLNNVGAIKTCGGLFDYLSGKSRRAPEWMQDCGLEWLYRLIQEPGRLWQRYLFTNIHALYLIARHTTGQR